MDHAYQGGRLRGNSPYGVRKAVQVVSHGYQNIFYSAGLQIGQNRHPEQGGHSLAQPHTQNFLVSAGNKAYAQVNGLVDAPCPIPVP